MSEQRELAGRWRGKKARDRAELGWGGGWWEEEPGEGSPGFLANGQRLRKTLFRQFDFGTSLSSLLRSLSPAQGCCSSAIGLSFLGGESSSRLQGYV